jgi:hypothetical protein
MLCPGSLAASLAAIVLAVEPVVTEPVASPVASPIASTPWIVRHPPARHAFELGLAFGGMFPPGGHGLVNDEILRDSAGMFYQRYESLAANFAVRAAYYPLRVLGVEVEGSLSPTYTREFRERANLYGFGGHLVAQLPRWSATPYLLAGGGLLGTSGALGKDRDGALNLGIGAKFFVNERLLIRCELRDSLAQGLTKSFAHYLQVSIGLSLRLQARGRVRAR